MNVSQMKTAYVVMVVKHGYMLHASRCLMMYVLQEFAAKQQLKFYCAACKPCFKEGCGLETKNIQRTLLHIFMTLSVHNTKIYNVHMYCFLPITLFFSE